MPYFRKRGQKTDIHWDTFQNTRYPVPNSARAGGNRWGDNKRWAEKMRRKHGY